ncbi:aspartate dehydrogenase [Variovorax sp. tm]|uniref:aspartate dehydrogenase n=1 Tax=Variovorax atrisoli TaxID=3394203 RepID=UPI003A80194C
MNIPPHGEPRVAVLGLGAIGKRVLQELRDYLLPDGVYAGYDRTEALEKLAGAGGIQFVASVDALLDWRPDLAIECAGHAVVLGVVPQLLRHGVDVMLVSIGALADDELRAYLQACARLGGARLITVSGAIGGLDALDAARRAALKSVTYIGRKPPLAWRGTPAETVVDLAALATPTVIYEGTARGSARQFPKNANVTAAVALAGIGFDRTQVKLVADPTVERNVHELEVQGDFGSFFIRLENNPLPDNPKTSWLAALSIEAELRKYFQLPSQH